MRINSRSLRSLSFLTLALSFGFSLSGSPQASAQQSCASVIESHDLGLNLDPKKINSHILKYADHEYLLISNTESLIRYTNNGGSPREGIAPAWSSAMAMAQVLGLRGPLAAGPLSPRGGVLGQSIWHSSFWINQYFNAVQSTPLGNAWLQYVGQDGPLRDAYSPMKKFGPLYGNNRESVYNVLGSSGFLGALVLGPVGPLGGLQTMGLRGPDEDGNYHDYESGVIRESVTLNKGKNKRTYRIFKYLATAYAEKISKLWKLDTSFAVDANMDAGQTQKTFQLQNPQDQIISFLVIPEGAIFGENYDLTVRDEQGNLILSSKNTEEVNLVQIRATGGAKLSVEIEAQSAISTSGFRLVVVGDPYFDISREGVLDTPQALPMPQR